MMVLEGPGAPAYLTAMALELWRFGAKSHLSAGGFGYLDQAGQIDQTMGRPLWITCRMTHCFALATLMDQPGAAALTDHGLAALAGPFADQTNGGWYATLNADASPASPTKQAYGHAFVVLAAASAALAGRPGAHDLLDQALTVVDRRFWEGCPQAMADQASEDFSQLEFYRGANANMHTVEAFSAAAQATGDQEWNRRALTMCQLIIDHHARANHWRIPEHYHPDWSVDLDYNQRTPAHQFRPYGATPGHGFEWARLLVQLQAHLGEAAPAWLGQAAAALYDRAVADGWEAEPMPGFAYTTDWEGSVVLRERLHWVMAEATAAAAVLYKATGQQRYLADYQRWWQVIDSHFIDRAEGSWFHELSPSGQPSATVWPGKPDIYHALQACLIPQMPISSAVAAGLLASR